MEYDAELRHARWFQENQLTGHIYNDKKQRWPDGTPIYTSVVTGCLNTDTFNVGQETNGVYQTLNTKYKVEFAPRAALNSKMGE